MVLHRFACTTLTLLVLAASAHAASELRSLSHIAAVNAALPPAPHIKEEDFSRRSRLREVKLSPDGAWLAYLESDGKSSSLKLQDITSGNKKQLLAGLGRVELHWSRDSQVLFIDSGDGVSMVRIRDGGSAKIAAFDSGSGAQMRAVDQRRPQGGARVRPRGYRGCNSPSTVGSSSDTVG